MFFKKKKASSEAKIILGMIMLHDQNSFDVNAFLDDFRSHYEHTIDDVTGDQSTLVMGVDGETMAIGHMPVPVPKGDIESTAQYAYNWQTAAEDLSAHQGHLIVSAMGKHGNPVERHRLFTLVICSLLRTTNAIGVYMGNQSLLIPKQDYLDEAALMSDDYLPLNLWIFFGLRMDDGGQSGYTYGLQEFNKHEMEVLQSAKSIEEIREFLFNMTHYVLDFDVTFKDGQTCGMSAEERVPISFSKGKLLEGKTFKLLY